MAAPRVACIGPFLWDHLDLGSRTATLPGGNGVFFSGTAVRTGATVSLAGRFATDEPGRALRQAVADLGVDLSLATDQSEAPCKEARIRVRDASWRVVSTAPVTYPYLRSPGERDLEGFDHLQVAGVNSLLRTCPGEVVAWVREARWRGLSVGFGLNQFGAAEWSALDTLVRPEDMVFANGEEYAVWRDLLSSKIDDVVDSLAEDCPARIAVTFGAEGVVSCEPGRAPVRTDAIPVTLPVCSVGAGDVLSGVACVRALEGRSWTDAVVEGLVEACERVGRVDWRAPRP